MTISYTPEEITEILNDYFSGITHKQYVGARYVPIFGRKNEDSIIWDNTGTYEPLTIVLYQGNSYTSRQYVPIGIDITNEAYWALTGNYNAQVEAYRREVYDISEDVDDLRDILQHKALFVFETVANMKASEDLFAGAICHTNGFHANGDNGAAWYVISETGTANEMDVLACGDLFANLVITESYVTPEMFGAYGDGEHDDSSILQYVIANNNSVKFENVYYCGNLNVAGSHKSFDGGTFKIKQEETLFVLNTAGSNIRFSNMLIDGIDKSSVAFSIEANVNIIRWQTIFDNIRAKNCNIVVNIQVKNQTNHNNDGYASENTFIGCKFYDNNTVIKCNNVQSVNNILINTACEHERGITNTTPLFDITAGGFNLIGCSIISNYQCFYLHYDYPSPYVWLNITNSRFEIIGTATLLKTDGPTGTHFHGVTIANSSAYLNSSNNNAFELKSKFDIRVTNFDSDVMLFNINVIKTTGVTIGSTGEFLSRIVAKNFLANVNDITASEFNIINDPKSDSKANTIQSHSFVNSPLKSNITINSSTNAPGNRIGKFNIIAPIGTSLAEFGIKPAGTYSVANQDISIYAIPDDMEFNAFDPDNVNVKLLGNFTTTAQEWSKKPTEFLSQNIVGYTANYTQGKYVMTGKVSGSTTDAIGRLYATFN